MDSMVGRHRKSTPHPQLLALRCRYDSVWKGGGGILPTIEGKEKGGRDSKVIIHGLVQQLA